MTAKDIINNALAARNMQPISFTCACCGDECGRDEIAANSKYMTEAELAAIGERFGDLVCQYCAEDMRFCSDTGAALKDGEGERDPETGELYASDEILASVRAEQADHEQHISDERRALSPLGFFAGHI